MPKISLHWKVFILIQVFAVMSWVAWGYIKSEIGAFLWGAQLVIFLPGYYFLAEHVEDLLWNKGLSLTTIGIVEVIGNILVNAILWYVLGRVFMMAADVKNGISNK